MRDREIEEEENLLSKLLGAQPQLANHPATKWNGVPLSQGTTTYSFSSSRGCFALGQVQQSF